MKKQATFHNAFRLVLLAGVISLILGPLSGCKKINNILFEYMPQDIGESDLKGWASGCWGDVKILKKGDLMEEDPDMKKLAEAFDDAAAELGAEKTIKSRGDICRQQTVVYQCKHNAADSDYDKETEQDFYRCKDKYGEWGLWSVEPIPVKEFPQEPIKSTDIQGWPTGCWGDVRIEKSGAMRVNPETKCQKTNIEYICKYHPKNNSEWNIKAPFYRCQDDTGKWGLWNEEAKFVASWPEPITHPTEDEMRGWLTGCYDDFVLKDYGRMQYVNRAYPKWNSQQISVLKESMSKFASKSDVDKMIEDTLEKTKTIRHFVMSNYGDKCVMLDANYFCGKEQEANSEQTKNKFVKCKNDKNQWGVWKKITKGESDIGYLEKQPTVDLTILTDARCTNCVVDTIINQMKKIFPSLVEKKLDYGTEDGKKLYESLKTTEARLLPAFLFDKNVTEDPGYQQVAKWMLDVNDKKMLLVGGKFDPTAEICDNQIDDTGNGKVDCDDDACKNDLACRKETKERLDLFVMSQCPHGIKALDAMKEMFKAFGNKIDFHVNYIANQTTDGKFESLHGQGEVDEDIRQLCVAKYYNKDFEYMKYIWCRNSDIRSEDWGKCATDGIDASIIENCSIGDEGKKLFSENIRIAKDLKISASPTWIVNNKFKFGGTTASDIKKQYCSQNPGKNGCE